MLAPHSHINYKNFILPDELIIDSIDDKLIDDTVKEPIDDCEEKSSYINKQISPIGNL